MRTRVRHDHTNDTTCPVFVRVSRGTSDWAHTEEKKETLGLATTARDESLSGK